MFLEYSIKHLIEDYFDGFFCIRFTIEFFVKPRTAQTVVYRALTGFNKLYDDGRKFWVSAQN